VRRARPLALLAALAASCPVQDSFPGDTVLGTFDFKSALSSDECRLDPDGGAPVPGAFSGTLSYDSRTLEAYLTVGSTVLRGTLSGDRLGVGAQAVRKLPVASCDGTLDESLEGQLIAAAPARAADFSCDALAALDGGAPALDGGLDAGPSDGGLDVALFCGSLSDQLAGPADAGADAACRLDPCRMVHSISGRRRQQ
jgi:hypothetical protein